MPSTFHCISAARAVPWRSNPQVQRCQSRWSRSTQMLSSTCARGSGVSMKATRRTSSRLSSTTRNIWQSHPAVASATHSLGLLAGFQVLYVQCAKARVSLPSKWEVKLATSLSWVLTHLPALDWERPIHQADPAAVL